MQDEEGSKGIIVKEKVENRRQRFSRVKLKSKREGWKVNGKVDKGRERLE